MRTKEEWNNRHRDKVIADFSPRLRKDIMEIPYRLIDIPEFGSYYIYGRVDTGKTLLAAHMYLAAREKQYLEVIPGRFMFTTTDDFLEQLKRAYNYTYVDEIEVMNRYRHATYLVLDDIGATRFTDWNISQLMTLINYRYEHMLITVFTSNLDLADLEDAMGDLRIGSRISRMCTLYPMKKK